MDDLRGQMSPKVVHSSPDLPRLSYGSREQVGYSSFMVFWTVPPSPPSTSTSRQNIACSLLFLCRILCLGKVCVLVAYVCGWVWVAMVGSGGEVDEWGGHPRIAVR